MVRLERHGSRVGKWQPPFGIVVVERLVKFFSDGERNSRVILPDLGAGCSMADMASLDQTMDAWAQLQETCPDQTIVRARSKCAFTSRAPPTALPNPQPSRLQ